MSDKGTDKQRREQQRRDFLLSFFSDQYGGDHYEEKEVNGFWLIKQWNGTQEVWQVAIYSEESYRKKKEWDKKYGR